MNAPIVTAAPTAPAAAGLKLGCALATAAEAAAASSPHPRSSVLLQTVHQSAVVLITEDCSLDLKSESGTSPDCPKRLYVVKLSSSVPFLNRKRINGSSEELPVLSSNTVAAA